MKRLFLAKLWNRFEPFLAQTSSITPLFFLLFDSKQFVFKFELKNRNLPALNWLPDIFQPTDVENDDAFYDFLWQRVNYALLGFAIKLLLVYVGVYRLDGVDDDDDGEGDGKLWSSVVIFRLNENRFRARRWNVWVRLKQAMIEICPISWQNQFEFM